MSEDVAKSWHSVLSVLCLLNSPVIEAFLERRHRDHAAVLADMDHYVGKDGKDVVPLVPLLDFANETLQQEAHFPEQSMQDPGSPIAYMLPK